MELQSKINKYPGIKFYNDSGVNVTKRVKEGDTKVFTLDQRTEAEAYARKKRSYTYDLRYSERKFNKPKIYGYAVPK